MLKSLRKPSWLYYVLGRIEIVLSELRKNWKRLLPGLIISLVAIVVLFTLVDFRLLVDAMRKADYRLVALGYLMAVLWVVLRGVVWRTLLQEKVTWRQSFLTINEGYLLNNFLPFRLGEVGRAFLMSGKARLSFWEVISTILVERALDVSISAVILLSTLPFVVEVSWAKQAAIGAGSLMVIGLGSLYLLARNREWAMRQYEKIAKRWEVLHKYGGEQLKGFLSGMEVLTNFRRFLRFIFWMLLNWGIAIGQFYIILLAFFPDGKLYWATFLLGVVALGIAVPSTPGNLGAFELAAVGALLVFGLDESRSTAMAVTTHLSNYLITGLLGTFALAQDGETLSSLYNQLRNLSRKESPETN
jgi:uncharacterized protein (TIRG00374 family)